MSTEMSTVSSVDEICAQATLNASLLLRLRAVARDILAERKVLQTRLAGLDGESLPPEERNLREAAYAWILCRYQQAETAVKNVTGPLAHLIQGELEMDQGRFEEALSHLKAAAEQLPGEVKVEVEVAEALRNMAQIDDAMVILERLENQGVVDVDLFFIKGRCLEDRGDQEASCTAYERALDVDANHAGASFRLAYYLDLRGKDEEAIELYKKVSGQGPSFVNAMVNLALLLEDRDDLDGAIQALKEVLRVDPTNKRAALFLRDCIGSLDMYYDETERKENERLEAILRIPCSEFELSVRSRNCLAKMNVRTLGDMARKTEQELLAYKNFGETSLHEIKNLLESKGLRMGMFRDEEHRRARAQRIRSNTPENAALLKPITDLELTVRARKCMQVLSIETVGDLVERTEADLMAAKNFGQTSLNEIKAKLTELGLSLKPIS